MVARLVQFVLYIAFIAVLLYSFLIHRSSARLASQIDPYEMAWFSSGSTNAALINNLARHGLITTDRVKNAMLGVYLTSPTSPSSPAYTPQTDRPRTLLPRRPL